MMKLYMKGNEVKGEGKVGEYNYGQMDLIIMVNGKMVSLKVMV